MVQTMKQPHFFGIRHLSPAGAYYLRQFLDDKRPKLVLIEGPCDLDEHMADIVRPETKPPIAILAYTNEAPVRTILYPFSEYSPEYQAILWCHKHKTKCRFMDLPSDVFLALSSCSADTSDGEEEHFDVYKELDIQSGEDGHETFWERTLEHAPDFNSYHNGANTFGANLRALTLEHTNERAETIIREAFMKRQIKNAIDEGYAPEDIAVVTGAYHVDGLMDMFGDDISSDTDEKNISCKDTYMTDKEISSLPRIPSKHTLMPYSYYRLSTRAGYGAGNKAPAYYSLLWEGLVKNEPKHAAYSYLSKIAAYQRENGSPVSSAQVIEAVLLAASLAGLRGSNAIALRDLRDAATTCLGEGSFAAISLAVANTEIGTLIGSLPDGVSRTSIQEDFYRQLKDLKLEKYRDITAQDLMLDLRENRKAASQKSAFLDLNRSFFLHQLRVLGISFAKVQTVNQDNATWSEHWIVRWSPEAEIELVESALRGDTVSLAASFAMKERVENASGMSEIALVIEDAFTCGMSSTVSYATAALQKMAVEAASLTELAQTAARISVVIQYGNIRHIDEAPLIPILQQLFYRSCLILPAACICDDLASRNLISAIEQLNCAELAHDFLDREAWLSALNEAAARDDLNTKLSGFAAAILLERGCMDSDNLKLEVKRRLSKGVPAELGAGWFEGLAMKNRYALIARLSLWENLDEYLDTLDDEEFKRALVFLRRAFADFTSKEKDEIAENLGEIWGLNAQEVSEVLNSVLDEASQEIVSSLDDFDFDL